MTLKVTPIAWTVFDMMAFQEATGFESETISSDSLSEAAGRLCYLSWKRPNPDTATNVGYIKNILDQGHYSVLEHGSASFLIEGISRSCSHQIARHRHHSISELSERFVDMLSARMITPPALTAEFVDDCDEMAEVNWAIRRAYRRISDHLITQGLSRKQVREAARAVMPSMTETKLVLTGNHRSWRHFLAKRGSIHADAEIRALAITLYRHLSEIAPNTYQDIHVGVDPETLAPVIIVGCEEHS